MDHAVDLIRNGLCEFIIVPGMLMAARRLNLPAMVISGGPMLPGRMPGGKTALVCLHDPALALDSCDILVVLQGGGVAAVLHPRTDPPAVLQAALAAVYGPLELLPVTDCRGRHRLALLPL